MQIAEDVALSHMMALKQQMDVTANNIANVNTTGYKAVELRLAEQKVEGKATGIAPSPQNTYSMVTTGGTIRDTRPGVITTTGNPLDLAIQGKGYFDVQNAAGDDRYTRNGVFQINADGLIVDMSGNPVQGDGGSINIPKGTKSISIGNDGTVSTPKGTLGRIKLVEFTDQQALTHDGDNDLKAPPGADPQPVEHPRILQGAIEGSNVNAITAMTQMIEVQRQYQSAANLVQSENDRTMGAIKDLSKLN